MIVVTLTKVPKSLKGDLTKWYQEIQTGVYVGNVSARVRDALWDRIMENIGRGEATMVYNAQNELGYQFRTTRQDRQVVDFDGIPLMMHLKEATGGVKHGFSDAAKFHRAKVMMRNAGGKSHPSTKKLTAVSLDIETTGLDAVKDAILSIGAVKRGPDGQMVQSYQLLKGAQEIPAGITALTGITSEQLNEKGVSLTDGLRTLQAFVGDMPIIGYNLRFDEGFLRAAFKQVGQPSLSNRFIDLMPLVKKSNKFLDNYRLETVLADYGIENTSPHHALSDAQATFSLASKLKEKQLF
ncbi:MAG: type I-E CRISPR-associated endoribonuclease Cas2e [Levilactobacillus sp.]|jgi:CRISPR-associated protein Cas2|uniref:type I-E CRISPR-associated endoribonuclease Cas2e n=1 Tax=Levilactobacillus sp. TaxID=2767919 RepID=UPI002587DCD2|nr:type I-E CRISPR-associated endoribonuclease Cas2e [Levilactobacillus sp.]MCH4124195.1 type I-E CRISPR-associated endoribonuclease Cas2e [Levilactobacillus sp.]MCI1554520.1 type I-E CRISPR-associated endoribonuclease Cas2e [Levilactobacillus sp.]MCI1598361.1 type I-E CRISPR-associated endoribonuclease Cas2e [Levilactobacillus sp.]MCI1605855.1 type I-E CRISPR-associated endoribonuclease Cas2e [Levilactobacillus sp.]